MPPSLPRGLSWPTRLAWLAVNLSAGLLPTLTFFAWVEQDAALPAVGRLLGWPWLTPGPLPTAGKLAWNAGLFAAFGVVHSVLAQLGVQAAVRRVVPAPAMRTVYLAASSGALLVMMGLWQPTGLTVWRIPASDAATEAARAVCFAVPAVVVLWLVARLGFFEFVGWAQLFSPADAGTRTAGTPELRTTGIYGLVRHPVYTGLLAMFLLGPTLSLDRLLLFAAALAYLSVGIPVEERKLIRLFGPAYAEYRRRVPALLPVGRSAARGPGVARPPRPPVTPEVPAP